jgi:hypothetical protein
MAIARNKPKDVAAIAAFGAAAEARPTEEEPATTPAARAAPATTPAARAARSPRPTQAADDGPASSLLRWKGEEQLRDRIKTYAKTERYSEQEVMIRALQLGMDQIENS